MQPRGKGWLTMRRARWVVVLAGVLIPYVARLPGGIDWLRQYTETGLAGTALLGAFNAIVWGAILFASNFYRRPASLLWPALFGFGFLAYAHGGLDLYADAQAGVAIVFIPIYALAPTLAGAIIGYVVDRAGR